MCVCMYVYNLGKRLNSKQLMLLLIHLKWFNVFSVKQLQHTASHWVIIYSIQETLQHHKKNKNQCEEPVASSRCMDQHQPNMVSWKQVSSYLNFSFVFHGFRVKILLITLFSLHRHNQVLQKIIKLDWNQSEHFKEERVAHIFIML